MIRHLRPDEPIPDAEPRRYRTKAGYVQLRWLVGVQEYVEEYEHRIVAGRPGPGLDVHHVNHVRHDNRPDNLRVMTGAEHDALHADERRGKGEFAPYPNRDTRDSALRETARRERMTQRRDRMLMMRAAGARLIDIGAEFGIHHSGVSRWLRNVPR